MDRFILEMNMFGVGAAQVHAKSGIQVDASLASSHHHVRKLRSRARFDRCERMHLYHDSASPFNRTASAQTTGANRTPSRLREYVARGKNMLRLCALPCPS